MSTLSNIWLIICIGGLLQWCSNPLIYNFFNKIYGDKEVNSSIAFQLPYPGIFPWEINNNWKYIGSFLFQVISGFGTTIGHAIFEIHSITLLACGCMQLEYLHECLTNEKNNGLILK